MTLPASWKPSGQQHLSGIVREHDWPENVPTINIERVRHYVVNGKPLPSVTSVLKVLGLSTEPLIAWAASTERRACLEAVREVAADFVGIGYRSSSEFVQSVEKRLTGARAHTRELEKAGDIGTAAHQAINGWLKGEPISPSLPKPSMIAVMGFQDFWEKSGLKVVRLEQAIWDESESYAGTADVIAEHPTEGIGILDIKTSKGIYDEQHLQVAAYIKAARQWADVRWGKIVRVPKTLENLEVEVKPLGEMYARTLTLDEMQTTFHAALTCWKMLKGQR